MAGKGITFTPELGRYLVEHSDKQSDLQKRLVAETAELLGGLSMMQIAEEQGPFLTMLTRLARTSFAVEVGTFTGYSSISIADGLGDGGRLLCCDVSEEYTDVARRFWAEGGYDNIDLVIAPAAETLAALSTATPIDFAFIDADKTGYATYFELILERMKPGGLIVVDNVLWSGDVLKDADGDADTAALQAFNDAVASDERVSVSMVNVGDGLSLITKL